MNEVKHSPILIMGENIEPTEPVHDNLAEREGCPLRLWISYADANPANLMRVEKIVKHLSLRIEPSGVRWASLKVVP